MLKDIDSDKLWEDIGWSDSRLFRYIVKDLFP